MSLARLLTRLFGSPEEISGAGRCPVYLYRWTLLKYRGRGIYVHRFVGDDWALDLHDHPKRFISVGLRGSYIEQTPRYDPRHLHYPARPLELINLVHERLYRAPWIRTFPAHHIHRLRLVGSECWTLVIVLKSVRPWGFWNRGRFIHWRDYVNGSIADVRKACH